MSIGTQTRGVTFATVNDSAGQQCRLTLPDPRDDNGVLVMWSHPHAQTESSFSLATRYFGNTLAWACAQKGWMFAASNMHGNQWGNATALTDLANLRTLAATYRPVTDVILIGASMGGLATANAVRHDVVADVRGAIVIDAVLDLLAFYDDQASYQAGILTAYGAADRAALATAAASYNPMAADPAEFTSLPWQVFHSPSDTTVKSTINANPWLAKIAAAPRRDEYQHVGNHLDSTAAQPRQVVEFIEDCLV